MVTFGTRHVPTGDVDWVDGDCAQLNQTLITNKEDSHALGTIGLHIDVSASDRRPQRLLRHQG